MNIHISGLFCCSNILCSYNITVVLSCKSVKTHVRRTVENTILNEASATLFYHSSTKHVKWLFYFCSHTGSLKDRHIKNGDLIYAIFTPKENLNTAPQKREVTETYGGDTVRCHIMLKVSLLTAQCRRHFNLLNLAAFLL